MRRLLEGLGPSLSRHYGQIYRLATHVAFRDRYFGELPNQIIVRYPIVKMAGCKIPNFLTRSESKHIFLLILRQIRTIYLTFER